MEPESAHPRLENIKIGVLSKRSKRFLWTRKIVVLREETLSIYNDRNLRKGTTILLDAAKVLVWNTESNDAFKVTARNHKWILRAKTPSEARAWREQISSRLWSPEMRESERKLAKTATTTTEVATLAPPTTKQKTKPSESSNLLSEIPRNSSTIEPLYEASTSLHQEVGSSLSGAEESGDLNLESPNQTRRVRFESRDFSSELIGEFVENTDDKASEDLGLSPDLPARGSI